MTATIDDVLDWLRDQIPDDAEPGSFYPAMWSELLRCKADLEDEMKPTAPRLLH